VVRLLVALHEAALVGTTDELGPADGLAGWLGLELRPGVGLAPTES
jgi:hypothetical protein